MIDTLDAMTNDRPYRKALDFETAKAEIQRKSGNAVLTIGSRETGGV